MILFRLEQHYITHCYLKNTHLLSVAVKNCRRIREVATALHGAEMEHAPKYRRPMKSLSGGRNHLICIYGNRARGENILVRAPT